VIFDIVEYIIMEWTMPNESRICRRGLILKKEEEECCWPVCYSQV
jgi:hypothetical protein